MSQSDEVKLYTDFYRCRYCGYPFYSISAALAEGRCVMCKKENVPVRMEAYEVEQKLRKESNTKQASRSPPVLPPPPSAKIEAPPPQGKMLFGGLQDKS